MTETNTETQVATLTGVAKDFKELTDIDGNYTVADLTDVLAAMPYLDGYDESTPVIGNWSDADDIDEDERVMVVKTSSRRGEEGVSLVAIWAIPTVEAIEKLDPNFIRELITSQLARKLTNNALRSENPASENYPRAVVDFIQTRRGGGTSKKAFNAICKHILAALKKSGIKLSKQDLVDAMSSASFAAERYATLEDKGIFVKFLESAIAMAQRDDEDGSQFQIYIETRDGTDLETVDEVNFDEISFDLG